MLASLPRLMSTKPIRDLSQRRRKVFPRIKPMAVYWAPHIHTDACTHIQLLKKAQLHKAANFRASLYNREGHIPLPPHSETFTLRFLATPSMISMWTFEDNILREMLFLLLIRDNIIICSTKKFNKMTISGAEDISVIEYMLTIHKVLVQFPAPTKQKI